MSQFDEMSRLNIVLNRIKNLCQENDDLRKEFISELDIALDEMLIDDFFGTEGQKDPRGDQRNGKFKISSNIEGYDT